jgi:hypothetical protein
MEGAVVAWFRVDLLLRHLPRGTEKNHEKSQVWRSPGRDLPNSAITVHTDDIT